MTLLVITSLKYGLGNETRAEGGEYRLLGEEWNRVVAFAVCPPSLVPSDHQFSQDEPVLIGM